MSDYDPNKDIDVEGIISGLRKADHYDLTDALQAVQFVSDVIHTSMRHRMRSNIKNDPSGPRWARIPSGFHTCAFCAMLASRGFVYVSEKTAGGQGNTYHAHCSCRIEPSWDAADKPDDYHPEEYKRIYDAARSSLGDNPSLSETLAAMRKHGGTVLKDAQPTKARFSTDWDVSKKLLSMRAEAKDTVEKYGIRGRRRLGFR